MEGGVLHQRDRAGPARALGPFLDRGAHPVVGLPVRRSELGDRERLTDTLTQLVCDDLELLEQLRAESRIADGILEATESLLPLLPNALDCDHERRILRRTALRREQRFELSEDALAELVAWTREREGDVRMQTFETAGVRACAADAEVELRTSPSLLRGRAFEARRKLGILLYGATPPLDTAGRFESRHLRYGMRAREPVRRRKRSPGVVERRLLRYRRPSERTTDDDTPECARLPSDLASDNGTVILHASQAYFAPFATPRCP